MNLINFYVTKVLSLPYCEYDRWWIKVKAKSDDFETEHLLMFETEETAANITVGYKFLA